MEAKPIAEAAEEAEPSRGEQRIPERTSRAWGAFAYRDYRLLWSGLLVSNLGQWMQFTSLTYLVGIVLADSAAHSAMNLGLLGAARSIPALLVAPVAGYVADRYPRRRTLFLTNFTRAALALGLAIVSQHTGSWVLVVSLVIAGLFSAVQCFDSPARQSWVSFLVPRQLLSNAIGLNAFAGNVPLMVGPALAGLLIGTLGVYSSFYIQAITQWAVVLAVILMKPCPVSGTSREPMLQQIATGIRFVSSHEILRWIMFVLIVTCFCVRPYTWLLAGFAGHVLHVDAKAYGTMLAVGGIGTVIGGLTTALISAKLRGTVWFVSGVVTAIGLVLLGFVHDYAFVLVILTVMGWGTVSFISAGNVITQMLAPEEMRGRAMSLYSMVINGIIPAGTLVLGALGSVTSLSVAYMVGGIVAIVLGVWVWFARPTLRNA